MKSFYFFAGSLPELRDLPRRERTRLWRRLPFAIVCEFVAVQTLIFLPMTTLLAVGILRRAGVETISLTRPERLWIASVVAMVTLVVSTVVWHFQLKAVRPALRKLRDDDGDG